MIDFLVYDGPSDKHGQWVKITTKGGVQAAIVTVPLIPAYDEAFKSVKRWWSCCSCRFYLLVTCLYQLLIVF